MQEKKSKVFVPEQWGERAVWIYTSENFPKEKTDEFERLGIAKPLASVLISCFA